MDEIALEIPFTQYMRPNGRAVAMYGPVENEDMLLRATNLIAEGLKFEAEVLTTGEISLTVSNSNEDIAIQLCPNGPGIEKAISKLITDAELAQSSI